MGEYITLSVTNDDTIESVKQQIEKLKKIPVDKQKIFLRGTLQRLENDRTVSSYNLCEDSIVDFSVKMF